MEPAWVVKRPRLSDFPQCAGRRLPVLTERGPAVCITPLTYSKLVNSTAGDVLRGESRSLPRKSPYKIVLTPEEARELLRRTSKYTLPYAQVVRARMILLAAEGLDNGQIAARLDTSREVVSRWRKRFYEQGLAGLRERSRPGRPRGTGGNSGDSAQIRD